MSNEVDQIKQRLDIVEIVKEYVQLKKSGSNFKGLCPFHQENSPSFMVSQNKQIWHCFGCHKGEDMFSFVQEIEGLDFFESLKLLGDRAGIKIERKKEAGKSNQKQELLDILSICTEFYSKLLQDHPKAEKGRAYSVKRGLVGETVKKFQIGYAPDAWEVLIDFLKKRGFSQNLIEASGMIVKNPERGSMYDRFRDRFMIPLRDVYGNVVGFTARTLKEDEKGGKYINTPQTDVYDKSRVVFGLAFAKQAIKEAGHAVIVEGNMDVISSHQAGVKQVVAVSGTALTEMQLGLLKRFTDTLIFAFDGDSAGFMAMRRGVELALKSGFTVKVLELPAGKDPDDYIKEDVSLWKKAIEQAKPVVDVLIERGIKLHDISTAEGKKTVTTDVLSLLAILPNAVERDHYLQKLAVAAQVSESSLRDSFKKEAVPAASKQEVPTKSGRKKLSEVDQASLDYLALLSLNPSIVQEQDLPEEALSNQELQDLYKKWKNSYSEPTELFSQNLEPRLQALFSHIQLLADQKYAELEDIERKEALKARLSFLKRIYLRRQLQRVQTSLQDAEKTNDMMAIRSLSEEFHRISSLLHSLN